MEGLVVEGLEWEDMGMLLHRIGLSVWVLTDTKTGDLLAGAGPTRFTPKYKDIRGGGRTLRDIKGTGDGAAGA